VAEIRWVAAEHREALDRSAAARSAEFEKKAKAERAAFADAVRERSAELDSFGAQGTEAVMKAVNDALVDLERQATSLAERIEQERAGDHADMRRSAAEQTAAFEEFATNRRVELERELRAQVDESHDELVGEARRLRESAVEQVSHTRSFMKSESDRLEKEADAARDDMRQAAADQSAAFDELAHKWAQELEGVVRHQGELLGALHDLHGLKPYPVAEQPASTAGPQREADVDASERDTWDVDAANIDASEHDAAATPAISWTNAAGEYAGTSRAEEVATFATQRVEEQAQAYAAQLERLSAEMSQLEGSIVERLHALDQQVHSSRAEITGL
jgi:hypothetical protein